MLKIFVGLLTIFFLIGTFLWTKSYYQGPKSDHFDGRYFHNTPEATRSFANLIKWLTTRTQVKWPEHIDIKKFPKPNDRSAENEMIVTFVNHATVLVQWNGLNILTDPVWSERASPFTWIGPKRVHEPGVAWDDLPKIDVVLLSHNHYDHMDQATLQKLVARDHPKIISGLGNGTILHRWGVDDTIELDWWQSKQIDTDWTITYVPSQHFSARWPWDMDKALWGGFIVKGKDGTLYFAGDTGDGPHFQKIADQFAPIRLALIPIGAYKPEWFMNIAHIAPIDAVKLHKTLKSNKSMGIHFGTFALADEEYYEPENDLKHELNASGISQDDFWILLPGESRKVP